MRYLDTIKPYIPLDKPWLIVAIVLAVLLVVYAGVTGFRYVSTVGEIHGTIESIEDLRFTAPRNVPSERELRTELEAAEAALANLMVLHDHPESDGLVAILTATASKTNVWIERASIGESRQEVMGGVTYTAQPITIGIRGLARNTYSFLSSLHEEVPVVNVQRLGMAELGGMPTTQADLVFYLSPQLTSAR